MLHGEAEAERGYFMTGRRLQVVRAPCYRAALLVTGHAAEVISKAAIILSKWAGFFADSRPGVCIACRRRAGISAARPWRKGRRRCMGQARAAHPRGAR